MNKRKSEIEKLERAFWDSMIAGKPEIATGMLTEPAVMVSGHGANKFDHAAYTRMARDDRYKLVDYTISDMDVICTSLNFDLRMRPSVGMSLYFSVAPLYGLWTLRHAHRERGRAETPLITTAGAPESDAGAPACAAASTAPTGRAMTGFPGSDDGPGITPPD